MVTFHENVSRPRCNRPRRKSRRLNPSQWVLESPLSLYSSDYFVKKVSAYRRVLDSLPNFYHNLLVQLAFFVRFSIRKPSPILDCNECPLPTRHLLHALKGRENFWGRTERKVNRERRKDYKNKLWGSYRLFLSYV